MAESYQFIFIFLLILTTAVEFYLGHRQKNFVLKNKKKVPSAFTKIIKLADHKKAADYTVSKINFNSIELIFGAIILYLFTLGGGINLMNNLMGQYFENSLLNGALIITSVFVALHLIGLPSSVYQTFVIETKYGFNKITPKLFITDQIKSVIIMIILSVVFSYAALWILSELGNEWWLWLWIFLSVLSLIGVALAPVLKQVFNKYTPIKDKNLKKNIEKLLKRCGLGVESLSDANFLILFILVLLPFVMFFVGPFISWLQRKYEFEADEYACEFTKSADLKQSLIKLYRDNASTLTPDPLYSAFYHSHPPASIRIQAIDKS